MDYDNDGILDFISGSYDPGDLYLFRGKGKGVYSRVEKILDKSGLPVVHHPEELAKYEKMKDDPDADDQESIMARVASFGSWVAPVDWEADGDLDLLIGSFGGDLFLRMNEGSREEPVYGTKSIPVEADGKPLHVNMHAAPVVADWNDDGRWDLVVGSGDGGVGWFPNIGTSTDAAFGAYRQLVAPASDTKFFEQNLQSDDMPAHGVRAQICVTDYNRDGRLDLIVGDYSDVNWMRDLSDSEEADFAELMDIQTRMIAKAWKLRDELGNNPDEKALTSQLEEIQHEFEKLERKKQAFTTSTERASFVWLFLRTEHEPAEATVEQTGDDPFEPTDSSSREPVTMKAALVPVDGQENRFQLSVELEIERGWHLYRDVPAGAPAFATTVQLELPDGIQAVGQWERSGGQVYLSDPRMKIYSGRAVFKRDLKITRPNGETFEVKVNYQACTDKFCLPPGVLKDTVAVRGR